MFYLKKKKSTGETYPPAHATETRIKTRTVRRASGDERDINNSCRIKNKKNNNFKNKKFPTLSTEVFISSDFPGDLLAPFRLSFRSRVTLARSVLRPTFRRLFVFFFCRHEVKKRVD